MILIVIEGVDGTGKTLQRDRLAYCLSDAGYRVIYTREPYRIDEHVSLANYSPLEQLFLFQADRALHCQHIREWLSKGYIVICDRFVASTLAYQGYGHGLDLGMIDKLNEIATQGLKPDLTIWLDAPVEVALTRAKGDRLDGYDVGFYRRVRDGYAHLFMDVGNVVRVWADQSPDEVEARIWAVVGGVLPRVEVMA